MTEPPRIIHGDLADEPVDDRVSAVLAVLAGAAVSEVARHRSVDPSVLHRWVRDFVTAGTAQVTNQPDATAARQRDRFLAAIAHELRSPLAVALGWAAMLLADEVPPEDIGPSHQRMHDALSRLTERTMDLQLLAAASLGRVDVVRRPVAVGDLAATLPGRPVVVGEGPAVELDVDADLFGRVLRDLWVAGNVAPAPREVHLAVVTLPGWVEVRVVRDAEPIDIRVLQALFEPFDLNDDGTGVTIGLYLARALTVAHGGTVGVDQDDHGATLWVRVPHRQSVFPLGGRGALDRGATMTFKLACGDVMPGCAARFENTDKDALMQEVSAHAAQDHGVTAFTPEVASTMEERIQSG